MIGSLRGELLGREPNVAELDERIMFETLLSAHGVGPSLALAIMSVHGPDGLRRAVVDEDVAALCLVPGVGKKTAQVQRAAPGAMSATAWPRLATATKRLRTRCEKSPTRGTPRHRSGPH